MKASQTPLESNRFVCVCVVLEVSGPSGDGRALICFCPVADRWRFMGARADQPRRHAALANLLCVFYTTYVGKSRARLKISQFCQCFERWIHLCFHRAACLQGLTAPAQVLSWCGADNGKYASTGSTESQFLCTCH